MKGASRRRDLVLVTAGLELDGGGRAVVGRLLAAHLGRYAREHGIGLEILSLGTDPPPEGTAPGASFQAGGGSARRLGARVLGRHLLSPRPAFVYDLLGPARLETLVPAALGAPYALMMLGVEVWVQLDRLRCQALSGAALRLSISEHTARRAAEVIPNCLGPVDLLPLTLETRAPAGEIDEALVARLGEGFLLCVGRMSTLELYKGHDALLETMPRLLALHPAARHAGIRLVITGGGDDRARLEAKALALGLAEAVIFTGFVSEATLAELYARCRAFVLPSRGEGFGLVYLEAMRAGKPCIAVAGGAAAEVVTDGETGLLVPLETSSGPHPELLTSLERLLSEPALARRLGEAGRQRFHEHFSDEIFHRRLASYADRLLVL